MGTLVAGPWIGEFGWECAIWAPVVHAAHNPNHRTTVYGPPGHQALYPFATQYIESPQPPGEPDRWKRGKHKARNPNDWRATCEALVPNKRTCLTLPRKPVDYGSRALATRPSIVIHARTLHRNGSGKRNWSMLRWMEFRDEIQHRFPELEIVWIGMRSEAFGSDLGLCGTNYDMRGRPLPQTIRLLKRAHVCVGTSSGPMHLASVVGCPHVVLTGSEYHKIIKGTNRDRYERLWNPQRTPVTVIDKYGWRPPVEVVVEATLRMLEKSCALHSGQTTPTTVG